MIKAVINIESPRPQVFTVLTDYPRYTEWLPGCQRCTITASTGNTVDTEIVVASLKTMTLGLRFETQASQMLSFRLLSSKDVKAYTGSYRLMDAADGKGTVLIAEMEIDAGMMVPKFMVDRIAKKSIDDTGSALKKYLRTLPPPAVAPAAEAAKPAAPARRRRARRILHVVKTPAGHRVWLLGETFGAANSGS